MPALSLMAVVRHHVRLASLMWLKCSWIVGARGKLSRVQLVRASLALVERGEGQPEELAATLRECVDDLRIVIDSLEPMDKDLIALLAMLRFRLERQLNVAGVQLDWDMQDLPPLEWMGPPEALQVMRTVQEVLTNIAKHAKAHRVQIAARQVNDNVEVHVVDDGIGFNISSACAGRGLNFLKQRAATLGGIIDIESQPGVGTSIRLKLPIHK